MTRSRSQNYCLKFPLENFIKTDQTMSNIMDPIAAVRLKWEPNGTTPQQLWINSELCYFLLPIEAPDVISKHQAKENGPNNVASLDYRRKYWICVETIRNCNIWKLLHHVWLKIIGVPGRDQWQRKSQSSILYRITWINIFPLLIPNC